MASDSFNVVFKSDPNNWRPIAILSITYKIFARVIYNRIRRDLDAHQSEDQFVFRHARSTLQALAVLVSLLSKGIEWHVPVWVVSIDLKKVFDRVEHDELFRALEQQGLGNYVPLLQRLYHGQVGRVGKHRFHIRRGVRQGDVLSPVLFNAVLESAVATWKLGLTTEGFALTSDPTDPRLTNIRYVDDIFYLHNQWTKQLPCWIPWWPYWDSSDWN